MSSCSTNELNFFMFWISNIQQFGDFCWRYSVDWQKKTNQAFKKASEDVTNDTKKCSLAAAQLAKFKQTQRLTTDFIMMMRAKFRSVKKNSTILEPTYWQILTSYTTKKNTGNNQIPWNVFALKVKQNLTFYRHNFDIDVLDVILSKRKDAGQNITKTVNKSQK